MPRWNSAQQLLRELVALPSVHPEADSGGTKKGELAIAAWLSQHLRRLGADVETRPLSPGRPNVVAIFEPAKAPIATVALVPHLDTVGVQGMTVPPFALTRAADRLQGRGACDTKGPMAALLAAIARWALSGGRKKNRVRWIFAATAGEEQGSLGAEALLRHGFRADFAVALEPTNLRVVHAAKGVLRVWIEIPGQAAHGSKPELGVNAVYQALPLLTALQRSVAPAFTRRRHPLLGAATLNLGVLRGGAELNVVPSACRIGLDIRVHPNFPAAAALLQLRKAMSTHAPAAKLTIHREARAFLTDRADPWARRLRQCGRGWAVADWFCDANLFAAHGIPAVAFGPGRIEQAHTRNEFILNSELAAGAAAFHEFLARGMR